MCAIRSAFKGLLSGIATAIFFAAFAVTASPLLPLFGVAVAVGAYRNYNPHSRVDQLIDAGAAKVFAALDYLADQREAIKNRINKL